MAAVLVLAILAGLVVLGAIVWFVLVGASDRTVPGAVRESGGKRPELLGPGGPDDPDS